MVLAPLAVVPLGALVALVCWAGRELDLAALAVAAVAIGTLALGSRALHLDGLSDVSDGLTASYDRVRSLEVMKGGTAGPAGASALVIVLGIQIAALASIIQTSRGPLVAGALVCASRAILAVTSARGVPGARDDGLAVTFVGSVDRRVTVVVWLVVTGVVVAVLTWAGWDWWHAALVVVAGLLVSVALVVRCVQRFGGVTGDVFGASIEITLAAMLLATS